MRNRSMIKLLVAAAVVAAGTSAALAWHTSSALSGAPVLSQLSPTEAQAIATPRKGRFSEPAANAVMTAHSLTTSNGENWRIVSYPAPDGKLCAGVTWPSEGQAITCNSQADWFASGPVYVETGANQNPGQPLTWSHLVVDGMIDQSKVAKLDLVYTDCSTRTLATDADGFFLDITGATQIDQGVWPYKLIARDSDGAMVESLAIEYAPPDTPAAHAAGAKAPTAGASCA